MSPRLTMPSVVSGWIIMMLTLLFELESSGGHEIVNLVVPVLADPRENATLSCQYRMGNDQLYSAKWFKGDREIFRYMPGMSPSGLPFPVIGVNLARSPDCSAFACDLELTNLTVVSEGLYRCEISTEAPTFRIVSKSSNMTIAALPKKEPKLEGLSPRYSLGDEIRVNCTSDSSMPVSELSWHVNEKEASFLNLEGPWTSPEDSLGLTSQKLGLRLRAERPLFISGALVLRCKSTLSTRIPGVSDVKQSTGTTTLAMQGLLTNEKLAWPGSDASRSQTCVLPFLLSSLLIFLYKQLIF